MGDPPVDDALDSAIDVIVTSPDWTAALASDPESVCLAAAEAALTVHLGGPGAVAGMAILLTDNAAVADLNARFRGKSAATNVLSWPSEALSAPVAAERLREPGHLGDVAVALGVTAAEAAEAAKPLEDHLSHLIVHGVLHLLGYDHEEDADAALMMAQERTALAALGVDDPYGIAAPGAASGTGGSSTSAADGKDGLSE